MHVHRSIAARILKYTQAINDYVNVPLLQQPADVLNIEIRDWAYNGSAGKGSGLRRSKSPCNRYDGEACPNKIEGYRLTNEARGAEDGNDWQVGHRLRELALRSSSR
jgi:hypothetical protein